MPKLIIKIGWDKVNQLRGVIEENLKPLGLDGMQLGQLCLGGELAKDFANGGQCYRVFQDLKDEGLVQGYVVEAFPWTSEPPLKALRAGYTEGIIDGFIFYLNPCSALLPTFSGMKLSKRTNPSLPCGQSPADLSIVCRDVPGFAWKDYLQKARSRGGTHIREIRYQELDGILRAVCAQFSARKGHSGFYCKNSKP